MKTARQNPHSGNDLIRILQQVRLLQYYTNKYKKETTNEKV